MREQKLLKYLLVYAMWAAILGLGLWFLLVSRDALLGLLASLMEGRSTSDTWRLISAERFYMVGAGLIWLALMVISESYLRRGVRRGLLWERFARIFGVELLMLFVADAVLFVLQGAWGSLLRWLILAVELGLGIGCVRYARPAPPLWADMKASD
jgi:hypothetical protein